MLQNAIMTYTISYDAAYCAMMVHEVFRQITDDSSMVLREAAKAGIVHTMVRELNILKAKLGCSEVTMDKCSNYTTVLAPISLAYIGF